jgi:hypothetical protein
VTVKHTQTVTVETHQAGQPRAYADSIYEATLTFSWQPMEPAVKSIASGVLRFGIAVADKGKQENWAQAYWDYVRKEGPSKWRVRIIQPSTE